MKKLFTVFGICFAVFVLLTVHADARDVTFSWIPNSESALAGYKIYYGDKSFTATTPYTEVIDCKLPEIKDGRVYYTVTGIPDDKTMYFAATAYDLNGQESLYSDEITLSALPVKPVGFSIYKIIVELVPAQ
jgi:hypothetical protein